jgi:hypothetical protein
MTDKELITALKVANQQKETVIQHLLKNCGELAQGQAQRA